jgi:hypothetical protein
MIQIVYFKLYTRNNCVVQDYANIIPFIRSSRFSFSMCKGRQAGSLHQELLAGRGSSSYLAGSPTGP